MPVALTSMSTSPARGPARSRVSMLRGWPAFQATAARVFMEELLLAGINRRSDCRRSAVRPRRGIRKDSALGVQPDLAHPASELHQDGQPMALAAVLGV